jgi:hypothetical protein
MQVEKPEQNENINEVVTLTDGQAIHLLIQGVKAAQNKGGIYTLRDASLLSSAVEHFESLFERNKQTQENNSEKV